MSILVQSVSFAADIGSTLVLEMAFAIWVFLDLWFAVLVVVEITTYLMGVEIVLLDVEWGWNLTSIVHVFTIEHLLIVEVVDDVTGLWINQVTSLIGWIAVFVNISAC